MTKKIKGETKTKLSKEVTQDLKQIKHKDVRRAVKHLLETVETVNSRCPNRGVTDIDALVYIAEEHHPNDYLKGRIETLGGGINLVQAVGFRRRYHEDFQFTSAIHGPDDPIGGMFLFDKHQDSVGLLENILDDAASDFDPEGEYEDEQVDELALSFLVDEVRAIKKELSTRVTKRLAECGLQKEGEPRAEAQEK